MTERKTKDFHWIGETLMAKEFGEVVEICNVDWSDLDEFEAEHKYLIAAAPDLYEAAQLGAELAAYRDDEDAYRIISAALAKARGEQ